jgi:hypothetical protein
VKRLPWLVVFLIAAACVRGEGLFSGGGTIADAHEQFRLGCPDGWEYSAPSGTDGILLRRQGQRPPDTAEIGGGLVQRGEFFSGSKQPATPAKLFKALQDDIGLLLVQQQYGEWDGRPAGWAQFRLSAEALEHIGIYKTWWAVVRGDDGWLVYRFDAITTGVSEDDFQEVVRAFEPLTVTRSREQPPEEIETPFRPCP